MHEGFTLKPTLALRQSQRLSLTPELRQALDDGGSLFGLSETQEIMRRTWHVEARSVRPDHRMVGHTGFLLTARRLAPGVTAPPRRRRPAKGAHSETAE